MCRLRYLQGKSEESMHRYEAHNVLLPYGESDRMGKPAALLDRPHVPLLCVYECAGIHTHTHTVYKGAFSLLIQIVSVRLGRWSWNILAYLMNAFALHFVKRIGIVLDHVCRLSTGVWTSVRCVIMPRSSVSPCVFKLSNRAAWYPQESGPNANIALSLSHIDDFMGF